MMASIFVNGIAEGQATEFDESGHATKAMYHGGQKTQD
jgi:hypothetical protein